MGKYLYKVLILGDAGVGKTSLMNAYVNNSFSWNYKATIGADFLIKELYIEEDIVTLQIWDTSGQERYNALCLPFYRGADCCIFMYDVTQPKSLENIQMWYDQLLSCIKSNQFIEMNMVLVGNKTDLSRTVDRLCGECMAKKYNMMYMELSTKEIDNINEPFEYVANELFKDNKNTIIDIDIPKEVYLVQDQVKKSSCC